jgi:hypothetical protein
MSCFDKVGKTSNFVDLPVGPIVISDDVKIVLSNALNQQVRGFFGARVGNLMNL